MSQITAARSVNSDGMRARVDHHISGWTTPSGYLDGPLTQLYLGRADEIPMRLGAAISSLTGRV